MSRWPTKPLGDIATVQWGNTSITKASYADNGFTAFSATGPDGFLPSYEHDEDGIVLSAIGADCGKCFFASGKWTAIKNTITITQPKNELCSLPYLFYFLNNKDLWPKRGGGQPFVSQGDARKVAVPMPPLPKQEQIVKLLDRSDELQKLRFQADQRTAALIPALFYEMFGNPDSNAKGWPMARLGDLILPTEQRDPRENPTRKFFYVDIASVDNKAKAIFESKEIIGSDAPSRARKVIRTGDVIVSTVRPNLNAVACIPSSLDNQICSTGFSVLRPSEKITSEYLFALTTSSFFVDCLVAKTTGANYPAVNDGEVKDVPVAVPPIPLQKDFAMRANEIRDLKAAQAASRNRIEDLFQSLLHRAFNGEL